MKIQTLISYLQQIAEHQPNAIVYVDDGRHPSNIMPLDNIQPYKPATHLPGIYLGSSYCLDYVFDIKEFK